MKLISLIGHGGELLRLVNKSSQPADKMAVEFFRAKKYIGASDRRFISSIVFSSLRNKARNEWLFESVNFFDEKETKVAKDFFSVAIQHWFEQRDAKDSIDDKAEWKLKNDDLLAEINDFLSFKFSIAKTIELDFFDKIEAIYNNEIIALNSSNITTSMLAISRCYSLPIWIINKLFSKKADIEFIAELAKSFLSSAPLVLRVNRMSADRERIIAELSKLGITAIKDEISPDGLVIEERARVIDTDLYKSGLIEVQDSASQLFAFALNPAPKMKILDACAGAGGKSIHIATLQADGGEILSHDIEYQRLKEIKFRAARAGLRSITTSAPKAFAGEKIDGKYPKLFDAVVVDAPCSGMGTLRRSPNLKWKLPERGFEKIVASQYEILTHYSKFVRSGGYLIYATCSIMPQENEEQVIKFLAENPKFQAEPLKPAFDDFGIQISDLKDSDYYLTLYPNVHKTDGFFIAKMRKIE